MIIVPKCQATLNFMQETKELKDGRKVSIMPLKPKERRTKMVLHGFSLAYCVEVISPHLQVVKASRIFKGK